ncbi:acetyl-CoA synthetase-like protein [Cylindrobasidium torrendii FP15055 ss-10]|uniref:Acetyl-CoA synthetase-like protein n=1 Tax=Cylindrobasidium torrendii FP15055 ss-10 TaxID=1314674 RepID=A0A0D7BRD3_9AGAR|nr:acetyl-CoA synthetase-like protein [Cylindrobasidium torrendii FP15055 ss-10]
MDSISNFIPTPESIPPARTARSLSLNFSGKQLAVNYHPLNPLLFLLKAARVYPDKVALVHPETPYPRSFTFLVWAQRVQNFAYGLVKRGIRAGDRVAVIAPNSPMIADACHGIIAARGVATFINIRLTTAEVEYIIEHSGCKLILVDREFAGLVKNCMVDTVVCDDSGHANDPYEAFLSDGRRYSRERGWGGLDVEVDENAPATLCYTSGTTGRPKGVLCTLRGTYLAAVANAFEGQMNKDSVYLWLLPMFHAAGWTYPWAATFAFSSQVTLRTVDYPAIWKHFTQSGVTHYCAAPTVQIGIVNDPQARALQRSITAIIAGAAPTASLLGKLEEKGFKAVHVYGLTETYGPFTKSYEQDSWRSLTLEGRSKIIARQGHNFANAEDIRVVQLDLQDGKLVDVPQDGKAVGEIVTRGNIVMQEYFHDPEATRKAFTGGYFHSGDLAVWHADGSVAVVDRSKDIIISGGENASSLAIEQELSSHPDVLEVSVVARQHLKWGERAMAFVKLHPERASRWADRPEEFAADLKAHAKSRLPGFACPEWVLIVNELPKTSTGKILKTELRKRAAKL